MTTVNYKNIMLQTVDGAGNTVIYVPYTKASEVDGALLTINGVEPDGNGNIDIEVGDLSVGSLPLGFEFFTVNPNLQDGVLEENGQLVLRELYTNLWEWVKTQEGLLITEEEWQAKYALDPNNVPYYSNGDNATTFRLPSIRGYIVLSSQNRDSPEFKGRYCVVAHSNVTNAGNLDVASILTAVNALTTKVEDVEIKIDQYKVVSRGSVRERPAWKPSYGI